MTYPITTKINKNIKINLVLNRNTHTLMSSIRGIEDLYMRD